MKKYTLFEAFLIILFCLLVWFLGDDIQIKDWSPLETIKARLFFISIIGLGWGLKVFLKYYFSVMAEKKLAVSFLEYSLKNVEEKDIKVAQSLKVQINQLIQDIKKWQVLSGKKRIPLHKLPWFLVIGPPHNGKTTLLEQLASHFSLWRGTREKAKTQKILGAQWFTTDKAVFLKYSRFQEEEQWNSENNTKAWLAILKTLKKYKNGLPLNGLIVTIDVCAFIKHTSSDRKDKIESLRRYIQDLHELLKVRFPVYFVLTKCDAVRGFMEYFGRFNASEREQIMGFNVKLNSLTEENFNNTWNEQYDEWLNQLRGQLTFYLERELELDLRQNLCFLPEQLSLLKKPIIESLSLAFIPNKLYELVEIRGLYLTSVLPSLNEECNPLGHLIEEQFGLAPREPLLFPKEHNGFFIKKLYEDLILPEAWMVETNHRWYGLKYYAHYISYAVTMSVLLIGMSALIGGYVYNKHRMTRAKDYLEQFIKNAYSNPMPVTTKGALSYWEPLREAFNIYQKDAKSWVLSYKVYQSPSIEKKIGFELQKQLRLRLLPKIFTELEDLIESEAELSDEWVKGYLALCYLQELPSPWVIEAANTLWEQEGELTSTDIQQLNQDLAFGLEGLTGGFAPDEEVVEKIKHYFTHHSLADKIYQKLKAKMTQKNDVSMNVVTRLNTGMSSFEETSDASIPQYYTKNGLMALHVPELLTSIQETRQEYALMEAVLGIKLTVSDEKLIALVNQCYLKDYIHYWEEALVRLKLKSFSHLEEGIFEIKDLAKEHSPIFRVVEMVKENIQPLLTIDKNIDLGPVLKPLYKLSEAENAKKLSESIFKSLDKLVHEIQAIQSAEDVELESFKTTKAILSGSASSLTSLMQESKSLPQPIRGWVEILVKELWHLLMQKTNGYLNQRWQEEILRPYEKIKGYYPFDMQSEISVSVETFGEFFAKEGMINRFVKDYLEAYLEQKLSGWQWKRLYDETLSGPDTALQLMRLAEISDRLYDGNAVEMGMSFSLTPLGLSMDVASVQVKIGKQELLYRHGPQQAVLFSWQPIVQNERVVLNFRDFKGENTTKIIEGSWGLFKLMEMGKLEPGEELGAYRFKIMLGENEAQFLLQMMDSKESFTEMIEGLRILEGF